MSDRSEHSISRRTALSGLIGGAGALAFRSDGQDSDGQGQNVERPEDTTRVPGEPARPIGQRSPFETPHRIVSTSPGGVSRSPLQDFRGIITPSDLHYERHHAGIPAIDPSRYSLVIHGMVERPTVFTLDDLKRFPSVSRVHFLECSGNGSPGLRGAPPANRTPQEIDGLVSTSEWTGVPLATLFNEVGVRANASWFLAEGMDAGAMGRSIPLEKGWDDALIAYGQNGEAIRPEQGYPARLLVPGYEGSANVKWIRRMELSDQPFMTRNETSKYTDPLKGERTRMFSLVMDAKSLITYPSFPVRLNERGWHGITGVAWSGRGRIARVEISVDRGETWRDALLQEPILSKCFTRFQLMWQWQGETTVLMSRATDETGYVQPTAAALREARGVGTRYHYNHIRAWTVSQDGTVEFGVRV